MTSKGKITATANHSKRTFTLRKNGFKYRTSRMSAEEFQSCLNNTENDWVQYMKSDCYYIVK